MPKKNSANNGYYSFVMELRRSSISLQQAEEEAERLWPNMSAAQREPYTARAKKHKGTEAKMTAVHENMEHVFIKEQEEKKREQSMCEDIKNNIMSLVKTGRIENEFFHIVHFNNFFTTTNNLHFPAEFAISRFNFINGVIEGGVYDMKVKPGKFPIGYLGYAKRCSDETHKLPYNIGQDCNLDIVIQSVFEFLRESAELSGNPDVLPPIYVKDDIRKLVFDILQQICVSYDYDFDSLRIYSLSYLMFTLHNTFNEANAWISMSQGNTEFDKDVFDLTPEIACEFHKEDRAEYCSRSHVIRMAYIVCVTCCKDLDIALIPGRHMPLDSYVSYAQSPKSFTNSAATSIRSQASTYANSIAPSYKSNTNTVEFDRGDDNWSVQRPQGIGRSAYSRNNNWDTKSNSTATTSKPAQREPRTDWRDTHLGRGRGRGIANQHEG